MADRQATLRIAVELIKAGQVAEGLALITKELERGGEAAGAAAGQLDKAAGATERLEGAQEGAADAAAEQAAALKAAGDAALEAGQDTEKAAAGAEEALKGVEGAAGDVGAALGALGDKAGQSGAEGAAGIDKLRDAEEEAAAAAAKLREEAERAAAEAKAAAEALGQQFADAAVEIRESGGALEVQRTHLQALLAEAEKAKGKFIEQGQAGKDGANATGEAILRVKASLADVNAAISQEIDRFRAAGDAGEAAYRQVAGSAELFESIAKGATDRVNEATRSLNEEFRLTPAQLGKVGQAVELLKIELLDMAERGVTATAEQIATVQRLEGEYTKLTARAGLLTNAVRDNSIRMKESGAQVQAVASTFQQLLSVFGPAGAQLGMLAGNMGQLAGAATDMKSSFSSMDLNTLGGSASKAGIQIAAVAAALLAAVSAGKKVSETNKENAQSWNEVERAAKQLIAIPLADYFDGVNLSMQGQGSAWDTYLSWLTLGATGLSKTGSEIRVMNAAMRDGATAQEAEVLATRAGTEAWKFYEQSVRGGATGHALWMQALRESQGDADKFLAFMKAHAQEMEDAVRRSTSATEARKKEAAASLDLRKALEDLSLALPDATGNAEVMSALADQIEKAAAATKNLTIAEREQLAAIVENIRKGNDMTEAEKRRTAALLEAAKAGKVAADGLRQLTDAQAAYNAMAAQGLNAISQNSVAVAQAISDVEKFEVATNGTTSSINRLLVELQNYIALGPAYSKETEVLAAALEQVLDRTTRLDPAQRANIEGLIELAKRTGELSTAEQAYAQELIRSIENGEKHRLSMQERSTAALQLADTLAAIEAQEAQSNAERGARAEGLMREIELIRAKRAELEGTTQATEASIEQNNLQGASLDFLKMREKQLEEQLRATQSSYSANTDAKRRDAEEGQKAIDSYNAQVAALGNVKTSHEQIHKVVEDGRVVWTNLKEDTEKVSTASLGVETSIRDMSAQMIGFRDRQVAMSSDLDTIAQKARTMAGAIREAREEIRLLDEEAKSASGGVATDDMQVNPPAPRLNVRPPD